MVKVKILDQEFYKNRTIFLKKAVIFNGERAGDRLRILTYYLDRIIDNGIKFNTQNYDYVGMGQEVAISLFELLQEEL